LRSLEERFVITITISADESVRAPQAFIIDRGELVHTAEAAKAIAERPQALPAPLEEEDDLEDFGAPEGEDVEAPEVEAEAAPAMAPEQGEGGPRRRRRRRRRGGGRDGGEGTHEHSLEAPHEQQPHEPQPHEPHDQAGAGEAHDRHPAAADHEAPADDELAEQPGEFASPERAGEPRRDGGRRRRGRRGGRRNRHRNGEAVQGGDERESHAPAQEFTPAEGLSEPAPTEPELKEAVADLDAAARPAVPTPFVAEAPQPVPPEEPVRRRSTVRERAPIGGAQGVQRGQDALPPAQSQLPVSPIPEPVVTESSEAAETDRPRRTGWWSRRFAGG
jgi:ribonuclease E